ncbi:sialyltransferase [Mannheimia granulomatis]|uniref:Sialyltransferase n=1 Tax=Mannheimia granulomatis TaxID=85402 RepID=A0A6G8JG99_9PAST|nr:glycosyltransferase family 52 [Mannheimia granulomatis]QIM66141.1 sialyltransferase [Mannheimia granulomatis]
MNLIICYTPLQVKIAEYIVKKYSAEKFFGVFLGSEKNDKIKFYFDKMSSFCEKSIYIDISVETNKLGYLFSLISFPKKYLSISFFEKVFLANVNSLWIQKILSNIIFEELYTFDDGLGNIIKNPPILVEKWLSRKIINCIIRNSYSVKKLLKINKKHFTIYPKYKNIISNVETLNIFSNREPSDLPSTTKDEISILIGQPIFADKDRNISLINKVFSIFNIDFYYPHPREYYHLSNIEYIYSKMIFEDYISELLLYKSKIIVYTFFSSVALNIANFEGVEVRIIKLSISENRDDITNAYRLFEELGIDTYSEIEI